MARGDDILSSDIAFIVANDPFRTCLETCNAFMARASNAIHSFRLVFADACNTSSGLVNEFREGLYRELLWLI